MYEVYAGILKMNNEFKETNRQSNIIYEISENKNNLVESYKLFEVAGDGDDYSKIVNLLNWESKHILHNGDYDGHIRNTAFDLFKYSFDTANGINCRSLSLALLECLLGVKIKTRVIYMFPYSPYDFDNHVVCEAWVEELQKWIMIDPTYNAIVLNTFDEPLNIMEIRDALANMEKLHFAKGLNYNGNTVEEDEVFEYYAKDMFRFTIRDIQGLDSQNRSDVHILSIVPKGYDNHKSELLNIDYRIACWGDSDDLQKWKREIGHDTPIYKTLASLY